MNLEGLRQQNKVFKTAQIIFGDIVVQLQLDSINICIGPHGAGLTNMIFMPEGSSVVEFPLLPHESRVFGHMSMALGLDYWVVPQVTAPYLGHYKMDEEKAATVVRLLKHIAQEKGINYGPPLPREEL